MMGKIGCNIDGHLDDAKFSQPIPWIGIYMAAASLACLIGMAADAIHGLRHRRFWFPCKFFSLNATSLTLIAVAVKLSVDLNTAMPRHRDQLAKLSSSSLICTAIGNSMPSLGAMENKEISMNVMAMGILVITVIVNICIQLVTGVIYVFWIEHTLLMCLMLILLMIMITCAISVPTTKNYLAYKYSKKYDLAVKECSNQTEGTIIKRFREKLMRYWMMAHTSSPQFVVGRSAPCTASGAFCLLSATILAEALLRSNLMPWSFRFCNGESDYKWSTILILVVQGVAVGVGTIAPAIRWFIAIKFRCPKKAKNNHKKGFKVERYWIENLLEMKQCPLSLPIGNRHYRKFAHDAKVFCLNFCIQMQVGVVLMSKVTQLISISLVSWILACCNHCKKLKCRFKSVSSFSSGSESQPSSKMDLSRFVLHLEGEEELVEVMMSDNRDATNHWIQVGEKRQPKHLIKLLEKSSILQGFKGVGAFDSDQVTSLHPEEPPNSWSLPLVTLTSIAVALPNISKCSVKKLIETVNEALPYVRLIENTMDREGNFIKIRKASKIVWLGVDLYHKWFDVDLYKLSLEEKNPKGLLERLADAAKTRYEKFKSKNYHVCLRASPSEWPIKVLAANSMYRISQTALLNYGRKNEQDTGESLFETLTAVISDILGACLTNLPRVISVKCVNSAIEEREESVRQGVYIFGKTQKIIEMLNKRAIPNLDPKRMTNIDDWRLMHKQMSPSALFPSSPENNTETASKSSDLYLTIE